MASNNDIADMQPDDVWVVRLYFCFDGKEAFAVEGDLYGRLDFKNGEVKEYVFHANHTSYPEHEQGFLALSDNEIDLEFVTIDTNGRETTVQAGETCRVEVVSTRQTKKPFLLRRSPRLMAGGQGCILNTSTNRCRKAKKGEADDGNCVFNTGTGRCRKKKAAPKKKKAAPKKKVEPEPSDDEDFNSDFEDSEEEESDDEDAKKPPSSSEDSDSEEDEESDEESDAPFGSMTDAQWHKELKPYLTEANMLGKPGKDGVTYKVDYKGLRLAVKQFKPKKAFSSISKEANLQERAAETGAAPKVYHVSRTHKYIVMDRMAKRIVDVYGKKGDTLSDKHQMELVDCFLKLDDADILHNDGNALNLMVDYDDRAIVIDFGLSNSPIKKKHRKKYTGSPNGAIVVYMMLISLKRYKLKAPILEAFVDASKTRAGLDAFLGKHGGVLQGGVLQGGQGRTKKPFLRRSPRLTAGGQGCVLNKATNMCRKTKDGQVDGNCMFNTVTGRCAKKKAAPKKKKKKAAPKKKAKETIKAVFRTETSRTWLGGVVDMNNAEYMNTTASKVKKAIEKLVGSRSVNINVQRYKQTKFFAIRINWKEDEDLGYMVDFYFEDDQHNQNDKIKNLFIDGSVIEVVDPYLSFGKRTSLLATKAMEELKKVLQSYKNMTNAQGAKKKAAPKKKKAAPKKEIEIVCDGKKCRRVPAPKKKRATGRLSARYYVDEMDGQAGDKVDIYEDGSEFKCLAYRKGKNGPVPYWARLGSPAAKKLGCE